MRMSWWIFVGLVSVQTLFLQYLVEAYLGGEERHMWYYTGAMGVTLVAAWLTYLYFRRLEHVEESVEE